MSFNDEVFEKAWKKMKPVFNKDDLEECSFSGYFEKTKGTGLIVKWDKRWCMVVNGVLFYFKKEVKAPQIPKGIIDLKGAKGFLYDSGKPGISISSKRSWSNGKHRVNTTYNFLGASIPVVRDFFDNIVKNGCEDVTDNYNNLLYKRSIEKSDARHRKDSLAEDEEKEEGNKQEILKREAKEIMEKEPEPVWKAVLDPHTKRKYYYNRELKITQWTIPDELKLDTEMPDGWLQKVDPGSGKVFYYRAKTGETTWNRPTFTQEAGDSESEDSAEEEKLPAPAPPEEVEGEKVDGKELMPVLVFDEGFDDSDLPPMPSFLDLPPPPVADEIPLDMDVILDASGSPLPEQSPKTDAFAPPPEPAKSDWRASKDPSGKTYYYNKKTAETTWTMPDTFVEMEDEIAIFDVGFGEELPISQKEALPRHLLVLSKYIIERGLEKEGLFKAEISNEEIESFRSILATGMYFSLGDYEISTVAGVLLSFFAELPGGLFYKVVHSQFLGCYDKKDAESQAAKVKDFFASNMAVSRRVVAHYIFWLLGMIASKNSKNETDARALSAIFTPVFFKDSEDVLKNEKVATRARKLVTSIIKSPSQVFSDRGAVFLKMTKSADQ